MIQLQASIKQYSRPATLFAAYEKNLGQLIVVAETSLKTSRRKGCVLIADVTDASPDVLFGDDRLPEAINAYAKLKAAGSVTFEDTAKRAVPKIENDGMTDSGPKFRLSPDMTSAQIAALAICWYVRERCGKIDNCLGAIQLIADAKAAAASTSALDAMLAGLPVRF